MEGNKEKEKRKDLDGKMGGEKTERRKERETEEKRKKCDKKN